MKPSIGRIVHYVLTQSDANKIEHLRNSEDFQGNPHSAGQHLPMIIAIVWPNEYGDSHDGVNGQVIVDGNFGLWITSVKEGEGPGTWHWPEPISEGA